MNLIPLTGLLGGPPDSSELGELATEFKGKKDMVLLKAWLTSCLSSNGGIWDGLYMRTLAQNHLSDIYRSRDQVAKCLAI